MTEGRVTYSFFMLRAKSWLMTDAGRALEWHSPQVWSWRAYDEDIRFRYGLIKLILILIKRCIINKNTFLITAVTTVTITRTLITIVANSLRNLIDCTAILIANILAAKNLLLCQNVALSAKPSPSFLFFFFLSIKEEIKSSNFSKHHPYYQQGCTLFKDQPTAREIQK